MTCDSMYSLESFMDSPFLYGNNQYCTSAQASRASLGDAIVLDCGDGGGVLTAITFASFGTPRVGAAGTFTASEECHASDSEAALSQ